LTARASNLRRYKSRQPSLPRSTASLSKADPAIRRKPAQSHPDKLLRGRRTATMRNEATPGVGSAFRPRLPHTWVRPGQGAELARFFLEATGRGTRLRNVCRTSTSHSTHGSSPSASSDDAGATLRRRSPWSRGAGRGVAAVGQLWQVMPPAPHGAPWPWGPSPASNSSEPGPPSQVRA